MEAEYTLKMEKAILHILDNHVHIPVLSAKEIEPEEEIFHFLASHIVKVLNSGKVKNGFFQQEDNRVYHMCKKLINNTEDFVSITTDLANYLFSIMVQHGDVPPGDVVFCTFEIDAIKYIGMMKFNYKSSYIHYVESTEEGNINKLVKQTTTLPSHAQNLDECVLINLSNYEIHLLEKEYEINGRKDFYLSNIFLKCTFDLSNDDKFKKLNKATQKLNKKYFNDDFQKTAKLQKVLAEGIEEANEVKVDDIAKEIFEGSDEIKNEYIEEIKREGLDENTISIQQSRAVERKLRTHKLKTDSGIEIKLPSEHYDNKDVVEFINNPDGTISILLKNICKISNR